MSTLTIAAILVITLWIIILVLYLILARRQPDIQAQMKALEEQLDRSERESGAGNG